jgi:Predicted thioesterase
VEGFHFSTEVAVRFAETDAQGVAHNSNYLVWFEVARVAYLAEHAGGYSAIRDQGVESFVLESHVRYLQPAHFDDHLTSTHGSASSAAPAFGSSTRSPAATR